MTGARPGGDRASRRRRIPQGAPGRLHGRRDGSSSGGDWMIDGVSLRSPEVADAAEPAEGALHADHARYARVSRRASSAASGGSWSRSTTGRRCCWHWRQAGHAYRQPDDHRERVMAWTRRRAGSTAAHPAIAADLADRNSNRAPSGFIVAALHVRRLLETAAFHGAQLRQPAVQRQGVATPGAGIRRGARSGECVAFIEDEGEFPSTMVDRITPAVDGADLGRRRAADRPQRPCGGGDRAVLAMDHRGRFRRRATGLGSRRRAVRRTTSRPTRR